MDDNTTGIVNGGDFPITRYVFTGKLMLTSAVFLFAICVVILFFQTYSRWFSRRRRQQLDNHLRIRRAHHFVFNSEPTAVDISQGLDPSVLKSLPTFFYSAGNTDHRQIECAVCLSKFMEKETCRVLPECNHWFHAECIDMWFQSHSNCPLCRSPVKRVCSAGKAVVSMEESVSCSRFRPTTHGDQSDMGVSFPNESSAGLPVAGDRKQQAAGLVGITVELPTVKDGSEER